MEFIYVLIMSEWEDTAIILTFSHFKRPFYRAKNKKKCKNTYYKMAFLH